MRNACLQRPEQASYLCRALAAQHRLFLACWGVVSALRRVAKRVGYFSPSSERHASRDSLRLCGRQTAQTAMLYQNYVSPRLGGRQMDGHPCYDKTITHESQSGCLVHRRVASMA